MSEHGRHREREREKPISIVRFSQTSSAKPLTPKHIDSWAGDIGSMFGLSLLCPACHCVCVAKRNHAQWVGVEQEVECVRKREGEDSALMQAYTVSSSDIKQTFFVFYLFLTSQIFHANTDPAEVVLNRVPQPVLARFVRIRPQSWKNGIALRFELYGCQITGAASHSHSLNRKKK